MCGRLWSRGGAEMRKNSICGIAFFMIYLVVSLTFVSANAFAVNVKITKNEGKNGIPGVLDAQGDIWNLEAVVEGAINEVKAEDMSLTVEGADLGKFDSCSSEFGNYKCILQKGLTEIQEGDYNFAAVLTYLDPLGVAQTTKGSGLVIFDGSGPSVELLSLVQEEGKMKIKFTAKDKPASNCAGLEKVELLDGTGAVLHTFESGFTESEKCNELSKEEAIELSYTDAGTKVFKLKAYDKLGHTAYSAAKSFTYDKAAPVIGEGLWLNVGIYAGTKPLKLEAAVNVTEEGALLSSDVKITTPFWTDKAADSCTELEEHHYYCKWSGVDVTLSDSVTFTVTAKDKWGNTASKPFPKSFTIDTEAPKVVSFGSDTKWDSADEGNDKNYIKNKDSKLIAKIEDTGSGLDVTSVFADLQELGKGGYEKPACTQDGSLWTCVWELGTVSAKTYFNAVLRLGVKDNAGNEILEAQTVALYYDDLAPVVEEFTVTGLGGEGAAKEFFKSGDFLVIDGKVVEETGVRLLVDVNDILTNAADWPQLAGEESGVIEVAGNCLQNITDFIWECQWTIENIKSGPDTAAIKFKVEDTAGNAALEFTDKISENLQNPEKGKQCSYSASTGFETCHLELLGLDTSMMPNFWTVAPTGQLGFIDLDITNLINARANFELRLSSTAPNVQAKYIEFANPAEPCKEKGVSSGALESNGTTTQGIPLSRAFILNNFESVNPQVIVELQPFDSDELLKDKIKALGKEKGTFTTLDIPLTCDLKIYSVQGKDIFEQPETKTAELVIKFGYTRLGAADENMEKKIDAIKDEVLFEIADTLEILNEIMQWLKWIADILSIILTVNEILNIAKGHTEALRTIPLVGVGVATGLCSVDNNVQTAISSIIPYFEIPINILSCNPNTQIPYYQDLQENVLYGYNLASGRYLIGQPAKSLYENVYTSAAGFCLPGILYNLEKYRQVRCREIVCLKNEVPAGLATPDSCSSLGEYLSCRYWTGPAVSLTPLAIWDVFVTWLKSWASSPLGFIRLALQLPCLVACAKSSLTSAYCTYPAILLKSIDIIDNVVGIIYNRPTITVNPYCSQI